MEFLRRAERIWAVLSCCGQKSTAGIAKSHRWERAGCVFTEGDGEFWSSRAEANLRTEQGVVYFDKIKWNIPSDATEKEPRDRATG